MPDRRSSPPDQREAWEAQRRLRERLERVEWQAERLLVRHDEADQ